MNKTLSIQAYSIRDKLNTLEETKEAFKALASYGYTGVQTAGEPSYGYEEYRKSADEAGLKIIGTHLGIDLFENTDETIRIHNILGTKNAGVGGMPGLWDANFSKETVYSFIERAGKVAQAFHDKGLTFTYHHHEREFAKIGNETIMDIIIKELNFNTTFVLDTYWLQAGGVNIIEWLKKLEGKVNILHLKDFAVPFGKGGYVITELGNGNINYREVIKAAEASGVEHLCYEQDTNHKEDSLLSAKQSAEYFYSII